MIIIGDGRDQIFFDTNLKTNVPDGKRRCENSYGNYSTMRDALEACERDNFCQMVYNENCDDKYFTLCNKLEQTAKAEEKSCIFKKSKLTGS